MEYEEAKKRLSAYITKDGGLFDLGWYLAWDHGRGEATLDGSFTAEDLMAIAVYMQGQDKEAA